MSPFVAAQRYRELFVFDDPTDSQSHTTATQPLQGRSGTIELILQMNRSGSEWVQHSGYEECKEMLTALFSRGLMKLKVHSLCLISLEYLR